MPFQDEKQTQDLAARARKILDSTYRPPTQAPAVPTTNPNPALGDPGSVALLVSALRPQGASAYLRKAFEDHVVVGKQLSQLWNATPPSFRRANATQYADLIGKVNAVGQTKQLLDAAGGVSWGQGLVPNRLFGFGGGSQDAQGKYTPGWAEGLEQKRRVTPRVVDADGSVRDLPPEELPASQVMWRAGYGLVQMERDGISDLVPKEVRDHLRNYFTASEVKNLAQTVGEFEAAGAAGKVAGGGLRTAGKALGGAAGKIAEGVAGAVEVGTGARAPTPGGLGKAIQSGGKFGTVHALGSAAEAAQGYDQYLAGELQKAYATDPATDASKVGLPKWAYVLKEGAKGYAKGQAENLVWIGAQSLSSAARSGIWNIGREAAGARAVSLGLGETLKGFRPAVEEIAARYPRVSGQLLKGFDGAVGFYGAGKATGLLSHVLTGTDASDLPPEMQENPWLMLAAGAVMSWMPHGEGFPKDKPVSPEDVVSRFPKALQGRAQKLWEDGQQADGTNENAAAMRDILDMIGTSDPAKWKAAVDRFKEVEAAIGKDRKAAEAAAPPPAVNKSPQQEAAPTQQSGNLQLPPTPVEKPPLEVEAEPYSPPGERGSPIGAMVPGPRRLPEGAQAPRQIAPDDVTFRSRGAPGVVYGPEGAKRPSPRERALEAAARPRQIPAEIRAPVPEEGTVFAGREGKPVGIIKPGEKPPESPTQREYAANPPAARERMEQAREHHLGWLKGKAVHTEDVRRSEVTLRPEVFQHRQMEEHQKSTGDTGRLAEAKYDPTQAGDYVFFAPKEGGVELVHGHNRVGMLDRAIARGELPRNQAMKGYILQEKAGVSREEARAIGAMSNLKGGTVTPLDVVRVIKEVVPESDARSAAEIRKWLNDNGVSTSSSNRNVNEGIALARLPDATLQDVRRGALTAEQGATIGRAFPDDPDLQSRLHKAILARVAKSGVDVTVPEIKSMAQTIENGSQNNVGDEGMADAMDVAVQRSRLLQAATERTRQERDAFKAAVKGADILEGGGNQLARAENEKRMLATEAILEAASKLKDLSSHLGEMLSDAARRAIRTPEKFNELVDAVRAKIAAYDPQRDAFEGGENRVELPDTDTGSLFGGGLEPDMPPSPAAPGVRERLPFERVKAEISQKLSEGASLEAVASWIEDHVLPEDRKRALAHAKAVARVTAAGGKKKRIAATQDQVSDAEEAAAMPQARHVMQGAPPELAESPEYQTALARSQAELERADNPLSGRFEETRQFMESVADGLFAGIPESPRPPRDRAGYNVAEQISAPTGEGSKGKGWGLSTEFGPSSKAGRSKASVSFQGALVSMAAKKGFVTPEEAFHLGAAGYGPPIPQDAVALFPQAHAFGDARNKLTRPLGVTDATLSETPLKVLRDLLLSAEERRALPEDHPDYATRMSARIRSRMLAEEAAFLEESRASAAVDMGSKSLRGERKFLGEIGRRYAAWTRAAVARGYNLILPYQHGGKSPRDMWIDAVYHAEINGQSVASVVSPQGFRRVWRALELENGILTNGDMDALAATAAKIRGIRLSEAALSLFTDEKMTPLDAKSIVEAWKTGDSRKLELLGVAPARDSRDVPVPSAPIQPVPDLGPVDPMWKTDPDSPDFKAEVLASDRRRPDLFGKVEELSRYVGAEAAETAQVALQAIPAGWLNLIEHVEAGRDREARMAFAGLIDDAARGGESIGTTLDTHLNGEVKGKDAVHQAVLDYVHTGAKDVMGKAREDGWVEDAEGLPPSPEMALLARMVGRARRGDAQDAAYREVYGEPLLRGQTNPFWRTCTDCFTRPNIPLEEAEKKPWLTDMARRLALAFGWNDPLRPTSQTFFATQYADGVKEYQAGIWRRVTGSLRNRLGDVFANLLGSRYDESNTERDARMAKIIRAKKEAGWKLGDKDIHKPKEELTTEQLDELAERKAVVHAIEDPKLYAALEPRLQKTVDVFREVYAEAKKLLTEHMTRKLRWSIEDALKGGHDLPKGIAAAWDHILHGEREPARAKEILDHVTQAEAGATKTIGGKEYRSWGLRDYHPHMFHHADHGDLPDARVPETGKPGENHEGMTVERGKLNLVRDIGSMHGLIRDKKLMRNLLSREMDADGWVDDPIWAASMYVGRMIDKVYHERTIDDLTLQVFGDYKPLSLDSQESLANELGKVPNEGTFDTHASFGSVDANFGMQLRGKLAGARYMTLKGGQWRAEKISADDKVTLAKRWRSDKWRTLTSHTKLEGDPDHWQLAVSNGREALVFGARVGKDGKLVMRKDGSGPVKRGVDAIRDAAPHVRHGGLVNWTMPEAYNEIKRVVREALGYDLDEGKLVAGAKPNGLVEKMNDAMEVLGESLYHTQLGGVINPKAGIVQFAEASMANFAAMGGKAWLSSVGDVMGGGMKFMWKVLSAAEPRLAYDQAKEEMAGTRFVQRVLPVLEAGHITLPHLLIAHGEAGRATSPGGDLWRRMRRLSFASFTIADMLTKYHAYYGTWMQHREVGRWTSPDTGRVLKVSPDYIPVGERYTRNRDTISAHDVARMVMSRTHHTNMRYEQPGLLKAPGWGVVGHLGTIATNLTMSFYRDMAATSKFIATGSNEWEVWRAQKAIRYMVGMAAASAIMATLFDRDIGAYVGSRPADVGIGGWKLGQIMPALKAMPHSVRIPAWQLPEKMGMPARLLGGEAGEGVPATIGDVATRMQAGQEAPEAIGSAARNFWTKWSPTVVLGPWSRAGRPIVGALTAERSDMDPDRPYAVRDPWWMSSEPKTRYRSAFDTYFGDVFLPGYSYTDAERASRAEWSHQLTQERTERTKELYSQLQGGDEDSQKAAYNELIRTGHQIQPSRIERAQELDALPSFVRRSIGFGDSHSKLEAFARDAGMWPKAVRYAALRYIMPRSKSALPESVTPELRAAVVEALNAP